MSKPYSGESTIKAIIKNSKSLFASKEHTHTMESIDGLQDAVNAAADSKFYVVTFDQGTDGQYHGDLTFAQIREKFEAGGNMVARIDGTDYIPLLSAATHQIIFSGIYQATSVSLTVGSNDVCTLTSTSLTRSNHNHPIATTSTNGFMSSKDKIKLDDIDTSKYETKEDAQAKYDEFNEVKKDKDIIVTYQEGSVFKVTHSSAEIFDATNNGCTVKFKKGTELLNILEVTESYVTFYMIYMSMDNKLRQQIVVVGDNSIMLEQDNEYDYAIKNHTHTEYANKEHTHDSYETKEDAATKFNNAKTYVDEALASKSSVQLFIWEETD